MNIAFPEITKSKHNFQILEVYPFFQKLPVRAIGNQLEKYGSAGARTIVRRRQILEIILYGIFCQEKSSNPNFVIFPRYSHVIFSSVSFLLQ